MRYKDPRYILYVDDLGEHLELVQETLERAMPGVIVELTCLASAACDVLNLRCFDLVISDINLRGELGTDLARAIKKADPNQPVLLVSEYDSRDMDDELAEMKRLGVEFHPKFSSRDLGSFLSTVQRMLEQRPCKEVSDVPRPKIELSKYLVSQVA